MSLDQRLAQLYSERGKDGGASTWSVPVPLPPLCLSWWPLTRRASAFLSHCFLTCTLSSSLFPSSLLPSFPASHSLWLRAPPPFSHPSSIHRNADPKYLFAIYWIFLLKTLFLERGEGGRKGEKHRCVRETSADCLLHTPSWWSSLQPRHVPWPGIEPVTFHFIGWRSIHWAIPARAEIFSYSCL